jgi:hypothetical protein
VSRIDTSRILPPSPSMCKRWAMKHSMHARLTSGVGSLEIGLFTCPSLPSEPRRLHVAAAPHLPIRASGNEGGAIVNHELGITHAPVQAISEEWRWRAPEVGDEMARDT